MKMLWRWFFRSVVGIGALFGVFTVWLVVGMNRPHVTQSDGYVNVTPGTASVTLSGSLPDSAANMRQMTD